MISVRLWKKMEESIGFLFRFALVTWFVCHALTMSHNFDRTNMSNSTHNFRVEWVCWFHQLDTATPFPGIFAVEVQMLGITGRSHNRFLVANKIWYRDRFCCACKSNHLKQSPHKVS